MDDIRERALYLSRLLAWKEELETNKHGFKKQAPMAIKLLEEEIKRKWPDQNQD